MDFASTDLARNYSIKTCKYFILINDHPKSSSFRCFSSHQSVRATAHNKMCPHQFEQHVIADLPMRRSLIHFALRH